MKLTIVILNYQVRYFLELCIKSVQASLETIDSEIIVVDNNSKDDSCEMLRSSFPNIHLIENTENVGFAKANNQGVQNAKGEYICILNPDTVVSENTFRTLLALAESKTDLGILGCRLIDGTGAFLPESKRNVPVVKVAAEKLIGKTTNYYANHLPNDGIGKVDILVGAFMLMKRSVYNEVGGFDEDYFMYGEDIDLSYKVLQKGYSNFYYGKEIVIHFKGESTKRDKVYTKRFYEAMRLFYKKHFKTTWIFNKMVELGTTVLSERPLEKTEIRKSVDSYKIISNRTFKSLEKKLAKPVSYVDKLDDYQDGTEYILENEWLSYSQIIDLIANKPENKRVTFKIHPKSSNFILGSNSSKEQGEIIRF